MEVNEQWVAKSVQIQNCGLDCGLDGPIDQGRYQRVRPRWLEKEAEAARHWDEAEQEWWAGGL